MKWRDSPAVEGQKLVAGTPAIILSLPPVAVVPGFSAPSFVGAGSPVLSKKNGAVAAYIEEGVVRVSAKANRNGFLLGYRSTGWLVGGVALTHAVAPVLTATTLSDCRIRTITLSAFAALDAVQREQLMKQVALNYALELDALVQREACFFSLSPVQRLALFLQQFLMSFGLSVDGAIWRLTFPIPQVELASYLRLSPEHTNRLLHRFRNENVITAAKWPILTIDAAALYRVATAVPADSIAV
ncbi:Crp/Fnr family transcriptional regulator [Bryobacter aggregatus]|uniref:Crp/Fnr family transcriptional regulator n=1 Tax=Bryobacter aggregatus TaxID=360054 RepID=UPI0012BA7517|nr:Crp/Fnr family transcriptional regulator [Bryobacter aggregatus]